MRHKMDRLLGLVVGTAVAVGCGETAAVRKQQKSSDTTKRSAQSESWTSVEVAADDGIGFSLASGEVQSIEGLAFRCEGTTAVPVAVRDGIADDTGRVLLGTVGASTSFSVPTDKLDGLKFAIDRIHTTKGILTPREATGMTKDGGPCQWYGGHKTGGVTVYESEMLSAKVTLTSAMSAAAKSPSVGFRIALQEQDDATLATTIDIQGTYREASASVKGNTAPNWRLESLRLDSRQPTDSDKCWLIARLRCDDLAAHRPAAGGKISHCGKIDPSKASVANAALLPLADFAVSKVYTIALGDDGKEAMAQIPQPAPTTANGFNAHFGAIGDAGRGANYIDYRIQLAGCGRGEGQGERVLTFGFQVENRHGLAGQAEGSTVDVRAEAKLRFQ